MTTPIHDWAASTTDESQKLLSLVQAVIRLKYTLSESERLRSQADAMWNVLAPGADELRRHRSDWLTADDDYARFIRHIEALRSARTDAGTICVTELAAAIDRTVGATRRLLAKGLIPGAERITPGMSNSPWIIPADAPKRFLARAA